MKKFLFSLWVLFMVLSCAVSAYAQDLSREISLVTAKEYGSSLSLFPKSTAKDDPIYVDWGDGNLKKYNIDPAASGYFAKVAGSVKGDTIRVYGNLIEFDCAASEITYLSFKRLPRLIKLDASDNLLTSDNLNLDGAMGIENLNLNDNKLGLLDVSEFQDLIYFSANNNENLGAVLFPEYSESLKSISLSKCDISSFNPVDLPVLTSLTLSNCALMDLMIGDFYPALESLDISNNYITAIDVTKCPNLNTLKCGGNQLTELNLTQNPEMLNLFCNNNQLKELNLVHNSKISSLSCDHNQLTELNVTNMENLFRLECGYNQLFRLDISQNSHLDRLTCAENQLEFLDFAGNPRMNYIDCRNNSQMTSNTVNYMFSTLLARYSDTWSVNLFVDGCNAEHANTDDMNTAEMKWKTDITGDGTAQFKEINLNVAAAQNGSFSLSQSTKFGKDYQTVTNKAMNGTPIKVTATADKGYEFDYVLVNGKTVRDSLFVVEEDANVEVFFKSNKYPKMALGMALGTELSFSLSAPQENTTITIDWGDGVESKQVIGKALKRFDGVSTGTMLTIKGDLNEADFSSYPGMGMWDNHFTSLSIEYCENLEALLVYMNPIEKLDVTECPNLEILDCSYCGLTELNVSNNPKLVSLSSYGNAFTTLDVSKCPGLVELNIKGNNLSELDLSANKNLEYLDVQGNNLKDIDLTEMKNLAQLYVAMNQLTELDITHNPELYILNVQQNQLKELDMTKSPALGKLFCADNQISNLDFSNQEALCYVDCSGNKMTAEALSDMYYTLPEYPELVTPLKGFTLWVKGTNPETANDAERAESLLATAKGWAINYEGDGSGFDKAYITIFPADNGKIEVFDAEGAEVVSGTKVAKNAELTVVATPDEGFALSRLTANGKQIEEGKFVAARSTDLFARFAAATGIDEVNGADGNCVVIGGSCLVKVSADQTVEVSVYSIDGKLMKQEVVDQYAEIAVPAGTYVVKTVAGNQTDAKVVLVR